jgi:hypothetical protein
MSRVSLLLANKVKLSSKTCLNVILKKAKEKRNFSHRVLHSLSLLGCRKYSKQCENTYAHEIMHFIKPDFANQYAYATLLVFRSYYKNIEHDESFLYYTQKTHCLLVIKQCDFLNIS